MAADRRVYRWLVDGVPVQLQKDGETRDDRVRLICFDALPPTTDWPSTGLVCRAPMFSTAGLRQPYIGVLTEEFLEDLPCMRKRNLAAELLERLIKGESQARLKSNVLQSAKFSELLQQSLKRYADRAV